MGTDSVIQELEKIRDLSRERIRTEKEIRTRAEDFRRLAVPPLLRTSAASALSAVAVNPRPVRPAPPSPEKTPLLEDIDWLAEQLAVCRRSAYDIIKGGLIPPDCYTSIGRRLRIRTRPVMQWLIEGRPDFDEVFLGPSFGSDAEEVDDEG